MGDVGDYWRDVKAWRRSQGMSTSRPRRRAQLVRFTKDHERMGFRACSEWHWQMTVGSDLLDYWPSKSKWRFRGETRTGPFDDLKKFIQTLEG